MLSKKGKTIIFTTHYLQEADDVAEKGLFYSITEVLLLTELQ